LDVLVCIILHPYSIFGCVDVVVIIDVIFPSSLQIFGIIRISKNVKNQESGFEVRKSILDIYKCPFSKRAKPPWKKREKVTCD